MKSILAMFLLFTTFRGYNSCLLCRKGKEWSDLKILQCKLAFFVWLDAQALSPVYNKHSSLAYGWITTITSGTYSIHVIILFKIYYFTTNKHTRKKICHTRRQVHANHVWHGNTKSLTIGAGTDWERMDHCV